MRNTHRKYAVHVELVAWYECEYDNNCAFKGKSILFYLLFILSSYLMFVEKKREILMNIYWQISIMLCTENMLFKKL